MQSAQGLVGAQHNDCILSMVYTMKTRSCELLVLVVIPYSSTLRTNETVMRVTKKKRLLLSSSMSEFCIQHVVFDVSAIYFPRLLP